jgi:hypothetical protein
MPQAIISVPANCCMWVTVGSGHSWVGSQLGRVTVGSGYSWVWAQLGGLQLGGLQLGGSQLGCPPLVLFHRFPDLQISEKCRRPRGGSKHGSAKRKGKSRC